jgi:bacteriocin-like protein
MSDEKNIDSSLQAEKIESPVNEMNAEELDQVSGGSGNEEEEELQH